jgi:hypothetical protein
VYVALPSGFNALALFSLCTTFGFVVHCLLVNRCNAFDFSMHYLWFCCPHHFVFLACCLWFSYDMSLVFGVHCFLVFVSTLPSDALTLCALYVCP